MATAAAMGDASLAGDNEEGIINEMPVLTTSKQRRVGGARFVRIRDRRARQKSYSYQMNQILADIDRLRRTTGALCDIRIIPESGNIVLYTAGGAPYGVSQEAYASIIEFMQSKEGAMLTFDPAAAYLDLTGLSGILFLRELESGLRGFNIPDEQMEEMDLKYQQLVTSHGADYAKGVISWAMEYAVRTASLTMNLALSGSGERDHQVSKMDVVEQQEGLVSSMRDLPVRKARGNVTDAQRERTNIRASDMQLGDIGRAILSDGLSDTQGGGSDPMVS